MLTLTTYFKVIEIDDVYLILRYFHFFIYIKRRGLEFFHILNHDMIRQTVYSELGNILFE